MVPDGFWRMLDTCSTAQSDNICRQWWRTKTSSLTPSGQWQIWLNQAKAVKYCLGHCSQPGLWAWADSRPGTQSLSLSSGLVSSSRFTILNCETIFFFAPFSCYRWIAAKREEKTHNTLLFSGGINSNPELTLSISSGQRPICSQFCCWVKNDCLISFSVALKLVVHTGTQHEGINKLTVTNWLMGDF